MTQPALLDQLAKELEQRRTGYKHDAPGTPTAVGYIHGPGGILSFPGVDNAVFHSIMGVRSILGQLPAMPSIFTDPVFATITGVTDETGVEPTTICGPGRVAGVLKSCLLIAPFGRYKRQTAELELDRIGMRTNRGDPLDLTLIGSPMANAGVFSLPGGLDPIPQNVLVNEVAARFWERNVIFHRLLTQQLWTANPANNSGAGAYREFAGFAAIITTGHRDAETGVVCPAVDSYVRNFNFGRIDLAANATPLVNAITDMYFQLKSRATRSGMMPVRWVIGMRYQLFYELTKVWPCSYLTYMCQVTGNQRVNINGAEQIRLRDEMRNGSYLLIDGDRIDVIPDDGIPELTNTQSASVPSGCFGTDIYFIPMSVVGGRQVTFLEHAQYQNPAVQDALGNLVLGRIEGAFITWPVQTRGCFQWESKIEPRLVLRTPWLAGRLQNVVYCPVQHERDAFPDGAYHADGGRQSRPGPSFYAIWQS